MVTASRRGAGAYSTLYTHVIEQWYNPRRAQEIVFKATPTLHLLFMTGEERAMPADVTVRLLESKGEGVDSFEYYDIVSTAPSKGAQAARFEVANYSAPITMSWQEEMEFMAPEQIADRIMEYVSQQELTIADRLARDIFRGNLGKATNIVGLEQLLFATTHLDAAGATAGGLAEADFAAGDVWRTRQHTNTYGEITRTAFTDDEVGGTGWEGVTIDFFNTAGNRFGVEASPAGEENDAMKILRKAYNYVKYGVEPCNLISAAPAPFDDYESVAFTKGSLERSTFFTPDGGEVDLKYQNLKYGNAVMVRDEFAGSYNGEGDSDLTGTAGNVYLLNTNYLHLRSDSRANMVIGEPRTPVDQHAGVRHILWRGQLISTNPRTQGRIFNYGV